MKLSLTFIASFLAVGSIYAESASDRLVFEGIDAYKTKNYNLAISKFTESIKLDPKNDSAYNNRGLAYREKKDYDAAISDFNAALKIKPEWFIYYNRGTAYYEKQDSDAAVADFSKALKLNPKTTEARVGCLIARARAYVEKQKLAPAMTDLNAAIKLGVTEPEAYFLRGILHKINRNYGLSLADHEKAVSMNKNDPRLYEREAYLLSACPMPRYRDAKKAVAYATKACDLTEWKNAQDLETLAAAYAEAGQFDDAVKFQKQASELDPKAVDAERLALYQQERPHRISDCGDHAVLDLSNILDKIVIKPGQKIAVQFQNSDDHLSDPQIVQADGQRPAKTSNCLWLDFRRDQHGRVLFLWHSFKRTLRGKCLVRLKDYDTYCESDLASVPVKGVQPNAWEDPVEELVLFDFKLIDAPTR